MDLLRDDLLSRGVVKVLGLLYYRVDPFNTEEQEPLRLELTWQFLGAGFMRILLDRIEGIPCYSR